jgi:trk system potassium uptake protein TrkH
MLPISRNVDIAFVDHLFLATSIVSTTGLSTIDFGISLSFFGELSALFFIQLGGIGYMALSSFIILKDSPKLPKLSISLLRLEFHLPERYPLLSFIHSVFVFTVMIETFGAVVLYVGFKNAGIDQPIWSAIFHSISAFCTAGFSLYSDSMSSFHDNALITNTILILSILGSVGFIVMLDFWLMIIRRRKHVTLTSKIILVSTIFYLLFGTFLLYISDGLLISDGFSGLNSAFFQLVSAHTTVGFNNFPIENLKLGGLLIMIVIMIIGASPAGTGGGIKTTSVTALVGLLYSILKKRKHITFFKKEIPAEKIYLAISSSIFYTVILLLSTWVVVQIDGEVFSFDKLLFECASALSTVGLSTGITAELSSANKVIISILMFIGRLGVMTFGFALISQSPLMREKPKIEDIAL